MKDIKKDKEISNLRKIVSDLVARINKKYIYKQQNKQLSQNDNK